MKKLLFTLCAVLGFTAFAQNNLTLKYADAEGNILENNELIVEPGTETVVHMRVMEISDVAIDGFWMQYMMKNQAGEVTHVSGAVQLKNLGSALKKSYFVAEDLGTIDGTSIANQTPTVNGTPVHRIVATNTDLGFVLGNAAGIAARLGLSVLDVEGSLAANQYTVPGNLFSFTVVASEDWDEEYATLDLDEDPEYNKYDWADHTHGNFANLDLKIINKNKMPKDLTGDVEFTVDEATGQVTAAYVPGEGDPENVTVTFKVNGEDVTMPYQLEDGVPTTFEYTVEAEGYNPLTDSETLTWDAPTPDQTEAPVITHEASNGTLTVTATGEGTVILNGPNNVSVTGNGTATAEVTYDPYDGYNGTWTATAQAEGELVSETTVYPIAIGAEVPTVATPVITFNETKDGEVVTAVAVDIVNYTEYTIKVNGEPYTAKTEVASFTANYTEDQVIEVTAKNDPIANHPEFAETAEGEYTLKKLTKNEVAAPEVTPTTGDDAVTLNITWPESDGTQTILVNGQESTQTSFPRQDEAYDVELDIYVTEGPTSAESAHYTQTITIPAKEPVTPTEQTGQPVFVNSPYENIGTNAIYFELANNESDPNATIYYQITYPDGTQSEWMVYDGPIACYGAAAGGQDGSYEVEAYAVAPDKLPSKHIKLGGTVDDETGVEELIAGKTVANVRYFNMAGQEMQEANGMTIVVTTYTDGTTSAIKVMK